MGHRLSPPPGFSTLARCAKIIKISKALKVGSGGSSLQLLQMVVNFDLLTITLNLALSSIDALALALARARARSLTLARSTGVQADAHVDAAQARHGDRGHDRANDDLVGVRGQSQAAQGPGSDMTCHVHDQAAQGRETAWMAQSGAREEDCGVGCRVDCQVSGGVERHSPVGCASLPYSPLREPFLSNVRAAAMAALLEL